jgi:hypothetical protein
MSRLSLQNLESSTRQFVKVSVAPIAALAAFAFLVHDALFRRRVLPQGRDVPGDVLQLLEPRAVSMDLGRPRRRLLP